MTKKSRPEASKQKQLRRQFGGAFGRAPANLQQFLASDLTGDSKLKAEFRGKQQGEQAELALLEMMSPEE